MQNGTGRPGRKVKVAMLVMATMGMLYSAPCSVGDLGHNIANGTLSFVKGYTSDLWEALIPSADQLIGE
jgi:hypothetical protein